MRPVDDLVQVLAKFHREVVAPDVERIVGSAVGACEQRLRDEMHALIQRLDRRETEYRIGE